MVMRNNLLHWDVDQLKDELQSWFPGNKIDILLKCYHFGNGDNYLDWPSGEDPKFTQSVIEKPEFQTIWHECRSRAELLWAGGQACIGVVCICDQRTPRRPSLVVSSTLQAVFQQAGYNTSPTNFLGPISLYVS